MTTRTSAQQSLAALVACDQSYLRSTSTGETVKVGDPLKILPDRAPDTTSNETLYTDTTPFVVPAGFVVKAVIERPEIGAKVVIYQNAATNETMVAFGGTDGPNAQDHVANTQSFGWSQWERLNKVSETNSNDTGLIARLAELQAETGTIHFTGQSLGGALAQYATASYIDQQQKAAAAVGETYSPSNISLTTFNGLGGKAGLEANGFSESLLSGLGQVAHYVVDNDLVSRLGGGHVGANSEVIRLDWRYNSGIHEGRPMDIGDSHRIETAFYTHLRTDGSDLTEGAVVTERSAAFPLVDTPNAVYWAQVFGNLGNRNGDVTGFESVLRLVAGAIGAGIGANLEEINGVARAYALTQYRSGEMSFRTYYVIESGFAGALYKAASGAVGGSLYILAIAAANTLDMLESMARSGTSMADTIEKYFREFRFDGNPEIAAAVAKIFTLATVAAALKDPLTLDLDNNGLDTTGIDPTHPILFDHDADGIKTATGWVKAADAFLVLDRNGNGAIDNGRELFGDATPLYAGGLAADGFAALAQEDTNLDGKVNAADARFASLRLWTDLNQDAVSQSNELFTLGQKGIAALIVAKTENAVILGNGNQIADLGGYIRSDGSGGTLGTAEQMADIDLASNPFFSEFTDDIPLSVEAQALPEMNGAGQVRSLQQAASLATAEGAALAAQLAAFASDSTRGGQQARLDGLLKAWADTSTMATTATGAFAEVNLSLSFAGVGAGSTAYQNWLDKLTILERFNGRTFLPVPAAGTTLAINFYSTREALLNQSYAALKESVYAALVVQTRLKPYLDSIELKIDDSGITLDYTAMMARLDALKNSDAANAVLDLADLQHYVGGRLAGWDGMGVLNAWVDDPQSGSVVTAALAATDLVHSGTWSGSSGKDFALGGAGADQLAGNDGDDVLMGMQGNDTLYGDKGNDVLDGGAGDDVLTDTSLGTNTLLGGVGNDTITSGSADNTLDGGAGDDLIKLTSDQFYSSAGNVSTVIGGTGNDRLLMGGGTDTYLYNRGDGQDAINDLGANYYNQPVGADKVVFGAGIVAGDLAARRVGTNLIVRINDPDNPAATDQITIEGWFNSNDTYRIESFVFADGSSINKAQMGVLGNVQMGTDAADTLSDSLGDSVIDGGAGNDILTDTTVGTNTLLGGAGNDTLITGNSNNTLDGGAGDDLIKLTSDQFYSSAGNVSTVIGGTGNDRLLMGGGTDTYLYNRGDGQDAINDLGANYYNQPVGADKVVFGAGIVAGDLAARRVGTNLIVRINDPDNPAATDQITIEGWFNSNDTYRIESFVFADGSSINKAQMSVLGNVQMGTDAADTLSDSLGDSVIDGGAGNDVLNDYSGGLNTLHGGSGNDTLTTANNSSNTLDAGSGDDLIKLYSGQFYSSAGNVSTLVGGPGNDRLLMGGGTDTYLYNRGDGQDTISDQGSNYYNQTIGADKIVFGPGILAGDLAARRVGDNLIIKINDSNNPAATDQITVEGWFSSDIYRIESFVFADGSSISKAQMNVLGNVQTGTDAADTLSDSLGDSVIDGGAGNDIITDYSGGSNILRGGIGNDYLRGNAGADTLSGEAGNDSLLGGSGNDTLDGGAGDDYLEGNAGSDTYIFRRGAGYDTLYVADSTTGKVDTLRLNGLAPDEVRLERQGGDLVFVIKDSGEWTKVQGFFGSTANQLDSVQFGDGTTWNRATLIAQPIWVIGSNGDDSFTGGSGNDFYNGGDGNDTLAGNGGNDSLNGGPGNDALNGGIGNDTLNGGLGADQMAGGPGNDTYLFELGDGSDRIVDGVGRDTLFVGSGLNEFGLEAERSGDDLAIRVIDSADSIILDNWYGQVEGIDRIVFGDGATLDRAGMDGLRNRPPTANPDSISVHEDGSELSFAAADLLANDIDPNPGDLLTVIAVGTSQVGATVTLADGQLRYDIGNTFQQLTEGETVHDSFSYTITDSKGAQASSLVNVDIVGINDAPVTAGDVAATLEDALDPIAGNVLANDSDVDHGTVLRIASSGDYLGAYGRLSLAPDGSYAYVLDNASLAVQALAHTQVVVDHFTYDVSDGIAAVGSALDISVAGINDAPVVTGDTGSVAEDGMLSATGNVLANDADVDAGTVLQVAAPGNYLGAYGTLALAADGSYSYSLNNDSQAVQSLASGTAAIDHFAYAAMDGLAATDSALDITVLGTNDAPITVDDADIVVEDGRTVASGNVLANDHDVDAGTVLQVAEPGIYAGEYGSLSLEADGRYTYTLDNAAATVQSLGRDAAVVEHFGYKATDGQINAGAVLDVVLHGTNDAPVVAKPLTDRDVTFNKPFFWQIPEDSFKDIDAGDALTYTATQSDGSALPNWLHFDAHTLSFSGMSPKAVMSLDVRLTVTDKVAATGSMADSLSVSDGFRLSINHGNQGVGNGQDAAPAGQTTNFNDGVGTSPGDPGAKNGNNRIALNGTSADDDLSSTSAAPAVPSTVPAVPTYLGLKDWQQYGPSASAGTVSSDAASIFARWLAVDLAVSQALAGNDPAWLDDNLGADTASLHMATSDYLGSPQAFGKDAFSLRAGSGHNLEKFKGLAEGLQKIV